MKRCGRCVNAGRVVVQYPQIILPAAQKPLSLNSSGASDAGSVSGSSANAPSPAPSNSSSNPSEQPPLRPLGKLEEMKGILPEYCLNQLPCIESNTNLSLNVKLNFKASFSNRSLSRYGVSSAISVITFPLRFPRLVS